MQLTINQHLLSMNKALTEVVIPALSGQAFAQEQAGLLSASLRFLLDVQEQQFAYCAQEYDDAISLLQSWPAAASQLAAQECVSARAALAASACPLSAQAQLQERLLQLKALVCDLMESAAPAPGSELAAKLDSYIARQLARETSWLRTTGFIAGEQPPISDVLMQQAANPL